MKIQKIISIVWTFLILIWIPYVHAVTPFIVDGTLNNQDVPNIDPQTYSIFDIISLINSYLWLGIWLACFISIIWNWVKLIIARWNTKEMKAATNAVTWCAIGLLVCILSYIIVNLALRLFA